MSKEILPSELKPGDHFTTGETKYIAITKPTWMYSSWVHLMVYYEDGNKAGQEGRELFFDEDPVILIDSSYYNTDAPNYKRISDKARTYFRDIHPETLTGVWKTLIMNLFK